MKKIVISIVVSAVLIMAGLICIKLITNVTFFKTMYVGYDQKERFIPKYSYFEDESGNTCASFKSLRSKDELEKEINEYLKDFEYFDDFKKNEDELSDGTAITYGYRKGDVFIQSYFVKDEGLFRRIYLVY